MIQNLFTCTQGLMAHWYILWPILEWWDERQEGHGFEPQWCAGETPAGP
jgi:hypothetical protein